ncbi:MAG: tetratricopeptide repeat protein [Acidobacteriota bacterium]
MKKKSINLLFILGMILLLWVTAVSQTTTTQSTAGQPSEIERAQTLLTSGKLDEAIALLSELQKSATNESQVNHLMALAYYQKNNFQKAIEFFLLSSKQSAANSKQQRQAIQLLAMSYYYLGQVKEAIPHFEQAVAWMPDNSEMNYALGLCYIKTQNPDKSREAFARMFAVANATAAAYLLNAQMLMRENIEAAAEKELLKALELDPKIPQANFLLGEIAIYKANVDAGIDYLKKEIALNPAFAMAHYRLGEAYTRQLKWDLSIAPLQKSIWLNPLFSGPYIVLGKVYLKTGNLANSEAMLRRAIQIDPNNYSAHHLLAQTLQQMNRLEEAKREFEIAAKLQSISER